MTEPGRSVGSEGISTRELMVMCPIAQHVGRPGKPTDLARIESLFTVDVLRRHGIGAAARPPTRASPAASVSKPTGAFRCGWCPALCRR